MKIIFCSSIYNMADYDYLSRRSKVSLSLADHNLNYNIIIGLDENMGKPLDLINNVQIPSYPKYPKIFFKKQIWHHADGANDANCGFINLPVFKHISRAITTYDGIRKAVKAAGDEEACVMTYDVRLGISLAIALAKWTLPNVKTCIILPDIPTAVLDIRTSGKKSLKAQLWAKLQLHFMQGYDSYVFLTEAMKEMVDVSKKTYTVLEGIYNNRQTQLAEKSVDAKVIFYSGQLNPAYGVGNLLDAYSQIYEKDRNYELWICGDGVLAERISEMVESGLKVKFFGYVSSERVRQLQAEASVLVNPRQNIGAQARYSFPSKTMEYLASGRPVVGYKLDGIPDEYDDYIQYVPDNSVEALRDKLIEVCDMNNDARKALGKNSREFILREKNPKKAK